METCNLCPLSRTCLSPVIRTELRKADVLIVLDSPDSKADFEGKAYAGPLGGLLQDIISDAGLSDYCVTYAAKCSPGKESVPLASIEACRVHLKQDIRTVEPKFILCMGDVALRAVTKKSGVKNNRGNELVAIPELGTTTKVFSTYSLEYVAKQSSIRRTVVSDLRRCQENKTDHSVEWKMWEGEIISGAILAYDIESVDSVGVYTDYPTQIAIAGDNGCFVALGDDIREIAKQLVGRPVVGHNSFHFDDPMMRKFGFNVHSAHDTMYLAHFLDETQPKGLEALAVKYLGVPGWKEAFSEPLGSAAFAFYNARDTRYTLDLFKLFRKELQKDKRWYLVENLIYPVRKVLDGMSLHGVFLSKEYIAERKESLTREQTEQRSTVISQMEKLIDHIKPEELNPNSTDQIAACLNRLHIDLPPTEKGRLKTSQEVLEPLRHIPFVDMVLTYRETNKALGTVKEYEKLSAEGDGRAHSEYKLVTADTGRTTASKPNVQNLDKRLKGFFTAPPVKVLLSCDYKAIEFRVVAHLSQEPAIIQRYDNDPNWDPHRFFAGKYYNKLESVVTKQERDRSKIQFGLLYLGTGWTLWKNAKKEGIDMTLGQCERLFDTFHELYPGFESFYQAVKKQILETGQIVCPTGFIRHFGDPELLKLNYGNSFAGKLRQAVNVPVQNLAAVIAFLAMKRLAELGFVMTLFIHDSISFELEDDENLEKNIKIIEDVMCNYPVKALEEEYGVKLTVPLMVESEIKRNETT